MVSDARKIRGFLTPEITQDNHVLGGVGGKKGDVLVPDRNWISFLPKGEVQKRKIETSSCTQFGWLNGIETLEKKKYKRVSDYSERFSAIGSENSYLGNDPHKVAEWIRKNGLIDEWLLPFTDKLKTWEEFMQPDPLPKSLTKEGKRWLRQYTFTHQWVSPKGTGLDERLERMWDALLYSPVPVSVNAWRKSGKYYVKEEGQEDNHWCLLVYGVKNIEWYVLDSYDDDGVFLKPLNWRYDFQFAKSFTLDEIPEKWWHFIYNFM